MKGQCFWGGDRPIPHGLQLRTGIRASLFPLDPHEKLVHISGGWHLIMFLIKNNKSRFLFYGQVPEQEHENHPQCNRATGQTHSLCAGFDPGRACGPASASRLGCKQNVSGQDRSTAQVGGRLRDVYAGESAWGGD